MVEALRKAAAKLPASKVFVIPSASALYTQDLPGWVGGRVATASRWPPT